MMKAVVIDDEHLSRQGIQNIGNEFAPNELEFIGQANSVASGTKLIEEKQPDLVFLDIQMGDGTGFDLLKKFPKRKFEVIFITAYPEYQSEAKQLGLIDYLLKPIDFDAFVYSVKKAQELYDNKRIKVALAQSSKTQLVIPYEKGYRFIPFKDILWCETVNRKKKTTLILKNGGSITANALLKAFDKKLAQQSFIRVHASFLINAHYIEFYQPLGAGGVLKMQYRPAIQIPVSRSYRDTFLNFLKDLDSDFLL